VRLFIAINFSEETINRLLLLCDALRENSSRGSFSHPDNLHLTLVFLGECETKQTPAIKSAIDMAAFEPFDLTIERVGFFKRDDGDLWWAGVQDSQQLSDMQRDLAEGLRAKGFQIEKRKFSPHITLGRRVVTSAKPWQIEPFGETVSWIDLMKSERLSGRLTYTAIYSKNSGA